MHDCFLGPMKNNGLELEHQVEWHQASGCWVMATRIIHLESKGYLEDIQPLINEAGTNQGSGGSQTYAKRYALANLIAYTCGEDDDDGEAGRAHEEKNKCINSTQIAQIHNKLRQDKKAEYLHPLLESLEVPSLDKVLKTDLDKVYAIINAL